MIYDTYEDFLETVHRIREEAMEEVHELCLYQDDHVYSFDTWVKSWTPDLEWGSDEDLDDSDFWRDMADSLESEELDEGAFYTYELIYTSDIREFWADNEEECEDALREVGSSLGEFDTIGDAICSAVNWALYRRAGDDLSTIHWAINAKA